MSTALRLWRHLCTRKCIVYAMHPSLVSELYATICNDMYLGFKNASMTGFGVVCCKVAHAPLFWVKEEAKYIRAVFMYLCTGQ